MKAVIVFTACSCRLADTGKLLQFDGFYTARNRVIHDGAAYLMVLVCHPTLFFIARFFNDFQLFRFAEFFALRSKLTAFLFVLTTVSLKFCFAIAGNCYSRTLDAKVNAHNITIGFDSRLRYFIGNLRNIFITFFRDTQCPQLMSSSNIQYSLWNDSCYLCFCNLVIHQKRKCYISIADCIVLVIPYCHWPFENG